MTAPSHSDTATMRPFQHAQMRFAAHIRNPERYAAPGDIEDRRLEIYRGLFYRNIESFIRSGFPILRKLYDDTRWHAMVRDFMERHISHSPYFLEIGQEFLAYLQQERGEQSGDPPFLLELAHYEWVELALDVAEQEIPEEGIDPAGDLLNGKPVVSPLAWSLAYRFPVHKIGPDYQPAAAGDTPTWLVVYRNRNDKVKFLEANAVTARLLELLQQSNPMTGESALHAVARELQHPDPGVVLNGGLQTMEQLRQLDIILGTLR